MKPTAKQVSQVREFINSKIDSTKVEDFDERIGIYFLAIELFSLAIAIIQIDNQALNFNLGLVIFIVGGVLSFSYEIAKMLKSIPYRFTIYKMLVLYVLSLLAACVTIFPFALWIVISPSFFNPQDLETASIIVILLTTMVVVFCIQRYTKNQHQDWIDSLEVKGRQRYIHSGREGKSKDLLHKIIGSFVPQGFETVTIMYFTNLLLVLSTIENQPVYEGFLYSILVQPLLWSAILAGMMILTIIYYRTNRRKSVDLLNTFLSEEKSLENQIDELQ